MIIVGLMRALKLYSKLSGRGLDLDHRVSKTEIRLSTQTKQILLEFVGVSLLYTF